MKKSLLLLLAVVVAIGLAACSSKSNNGQGSSSASPSATESASPSDSAAEGEQIELTFWRHDYAPEAEAFKKLIATFEEKHPNIKVNFQMIPNDQYETKIRTALAGGNPPDIMALDAPTLASYANQGAIIPLDDYFAKDGNKDDLLKPVIEGLTFNGKMYAAPNNEGTIVMFYNKKMFEEKGIPLPSKNVDEAWTWDQVLDAAKKLNDPAKGIYGWNPTPWGFAGHEGAPYSEMAFLWQAGAEILSPDGTTAKGYLDSPEAKKAMTFWKSLFNTEKVSPKELPQDAFWNGKVAIHVDGPFAFSYQAQNFPNFKLGVDYDVAPLWKDQKMIGTTGSWGMAITSKSEHPDEAWQFVNWVTGVEGSKVWYEVTKNLPARQSTFDAFAELKEYPMNIYAEQLSKYGHPRPVTPAYPAISEAIRLLFEDVGLGNGDVDEALAKAVKKIDDGIALLKQ
ncbi:ABC transporter substrate-binding protein [Cohnella silvisoli]|uniref:Sugar ABC transporter substrate-binding protein n=1 Tax=Cohnella silvisoli TaxID=2873699 RepID=A0ABV1KWD1_9BACL|nr:sugar ABC transporter substrate-binding protein [Cohnella silvisoli]MCD9023760.1 sugar ABC transporter substrate-binding protein [Cohnella silvisoli]